MSQAATIFSTPVNEAIELVRQASESGKLDVKVLRDLCYQLGYDLGGGNSASVSKEYKALRAAFVYIGSVCEEYNIAHDVAGIACDSMADGRDNAFRSNAD